MHSLLKMSARRLCRRPRDRPISTIYDSRPACGEAENRIWLKTGPAIGRRVSEMSRSSSRRRSHLSSFSGRPPQVAQIGPLRALRESWLTGIFSSGREQWQGVFTIARVQTVPKLLHYSFDCGRVFGMVPNRFSLLPWRKEGRKEKKM